MAEQAMNILILDDDTLLRKIMKTMLQSFPSVEILEATNGIEALEIIRQPDAKQVDIILCDLNMPEMDGMEFLRHLGEVSSDISVIVISSHDDSLIAAVKKMALAYGVRLLGSAQKPISRVDFEGFILQHNSLQPKKKTYASAAQNFTLESILHGVTEKQFEPFYQPKVEFKTGLICGAEALARWNHPQYGIVAPYAFIDILEKSGNIEEFTFLILEKAAAACRLLHEKGHNVSVSVNLSAELLSNPTLAGKITQVVKNAGADANHIMLEITESATMTNIAQSMENLARLKMHGFGLSIDDYGTGFSNMQQMTRVSFNELKIDQSFVKGCADNKELCVVVKSSIEMAHKLNLDCIAEGVETQQDWDTLKEMECDAAQGYFIAKPMNLSSFIEFCSEHQQSLSPRSHK